MIREGDKVHVNRDDEQWGRIAYDGVVMEVQHGKVLVLIGDPIRANVLCDFSEVSHRKRNIETIGVFIRIISVEDRKGNTHEMELWWDPEAKAVVGLDATYLDQVSDRVVSPYNNNVTLVLPVEHLEGEKCRRAKSASP